MPEINIKVRDKCAKGEGVIICNNSDYTVVWDLDEEWTPYDTKTMRVNLADGTYQDVVFTGNTATLPVLTASGWVSVGLHAGDIHTSRAARLLALSSVLTPGGSPAAPAEDVYAQIMAKLNELSTVSPEDIAKAVEDYLAEHPAASASMRVEGGYIQFSGDGETWENVIALADLKGPKGDTGDTGPQGPKGDTGPQGNPGKDGAGMDVTGATVDQTVKIAAVDGNGVPTAWEPVDMPSGSGEKAWILVADTVTEEDAVGDQWFRWNKDIAGNTFSYSELIVKVTPKYTDNNSHNVMVSLENNKNYWLYDSVLKNGVLGIMHFKIILSEGLGLVRGEWTKDSNHHGGSYATVNLWAASNSEFFIPVPTSVQIGLRDSPLAGTQIQVYVR